MSGTVRRRPVGLSDRAAPAGRAHRRAGRAAAALTVTRLGAIESADTHVAAAPWVETRAVARFGVWRQLRGDRLGLARAAQSRRSQELVPRTATADRVVDSICPYCAVGCAQKVYVKDERVVQIEGDPDSPISRGRLCPKGSASEQLVNHPGRLTKVRYRRPFGTEWEELELDAAMDMIADRVVETRARTWEDVNADGAPLHRTRGFAWLGGATLDTEENYLIKKGFTALGAVSIENQARI
jgi:formate dehydrogenase major subunit